MNPLVWLIPAAALAVRALVRSLESDADRAVRESREETERFKKQNERLKRHIAARHKETRGKPGKTDPAPPGAGGEPPPEGDA